MRHRRQVPVPVPAAAHNEVLAAAMARAEELEDKLTGILEPILVRYGRSAASAFREKATDHLTAAAFRRADRDAIIRAGATPWEVAGLVPMLVSAGSLDGVTQTSTMICVKPRPDEADAIADPGGTPPEGLHVTLAYLGDVDEERLSDVVDALKPVAASHAGLTGKVGGYGEFRPPGCGILLPDVPGLVELRVAVTEALVEADIDYGRDHGYQPHITVDDRPEDGEIDEMLERATGAPLHFDAILVVRGDELVAEIPLVGPPPITASLTAAAPTDPGDVAFRVAQFEQAVQEMRRALASGDPVAIAAARSELNDKKEKLQQTLSGATPMWSPPAGDEVVNVKALAEQIRAKTEPVRQALISTTMTPALEKAGLSFDVTNPLTQKALASTGAKVVGISETTRADVMKVVQSAWESGLSIDHTAQMISLVMEADARTRARTIARTELVGAVNGGSLAATQLVASATGANYVKAWRTAPGAPHPRHELYDGLDGQTRALDEAFDVGGSPLTHPGDPGGDPGEVINCRCTMTYESPDDEQADAEDTPDLGADAAAVPGDDAGQTVNAAVAAVAPKEIFAPISGGTRGALVPRRKAIESSLADIGKIVSLPDRANLGADVKITMRNNSTSRGHMKYVTRAGRRVPTEINVSASQHPAVTFAHEFGHLLDASYIGEPGVMATLNPAQLSGELGEAMRALDEAWKASGSYQQLAAIPDRLSSYYRSRSELWARSFSQWVGQKIGSGPVYDEIQAEIETEARKAAEMMAKEPSAYNRFYPEFWQPGDFDPIAVAIERVLRAAGLLAPDA